MNLDCGPCQLRPWRLSDADTLVEHANNWAIWLNLRDRFPHPYTQADADWWVKFASETTPTTILAIAVDGEAVGTIGMEIHTDIERCSAEVGYWLSEQHWRKGIMTAALRAFTTYAFDQFDLTRLYAVPFVRNEASVRILEKVGYQREGLMRRSVIKDGVVLDQFLYAYVV
ncbi:GNAT family N-acetyltransferase [Spirosoma validum]|uniref:GNAT family N-acetyltransferase n=1 Tax=Spirosoma validum TaxID=2771355 RepID=A0A927B209_9BACT|nr:GNAT family protein [Spirosoma validum]MBD2753958.1 GNAT family N-acetyltransferase [Spirosoma validum]